MTRWKSTKVGRGRVQAGIPLRSMNPRYDKPNGFLSRGVVMATYVADNPDHPSLALDPNTTPVAVYCDVLLYSSMATQRFNLLKQVLVSQEKSGLHHGGAWIPRATTLDIADEDGGLDTDHTSNPAYMNGDHVLVGFMDGNLNSAVILNSIPHPSNDIGNEGKELGQRMRLRLVDGNPDFRKHNGSFYGISDTGDFIADTTFANDGTTDAEGVEPAPPTDGKGSQRYKLEQNAEREVTLWDMSDPASPVEVAKVILTKDAWEIRFGEGDTLLVDGKDGAATLTLGDGSKHVAIVEALQAMWEAFKVKMDAFDGHTHALTTTVSNAVPAGAGPVTGAGNSGGPSPTAGIPSWDPDINSTKASIPDG